MAVHRARNWWEQGGDHQGGRLDDGDVAGKRALGADGLDAGVDHGGPADIVGVEEGDEGVATCTLRGAERGPALEEGSEDSGLLVAKPLQNLGEVLLGQVGDAVGEADAILNEIAAALDQATQHAHGRPLLVKRCELVAMAGEDVDSDLGVAGVVLRSAGREGAAVARQGRGVDGEEHEEVVLEQGRDDRALGELDATATGAPWNRTRRSRAQASIAAGRCSTTDSSGAAEPGTYRQTSCF
jgi:hypothetical protein